ncbi:MAG: 30S ribosomal protein S20 [Fimbriimonadaceae bacterium]|nr:30S ribosomal protein S20 [Alphaproteobacteria bacterium]
MANTRSAKKAIRKIERRTLVNGNRRNRMRTYIKRVENAIDDGDKTEAATALRVAEPEIMSAAGHGIIHRNTASRKVSRLSARVKAMSA